MSHARLLTIALIACLVLALAYVTVNLNSLNKKQTVLQDKIAAGTGALALLPLPAADGEARLADARAAYQTALSGVSLIIAPVQAVKALLDLTERYNFKVNPVSTEQWSKRTIGQDTYRILPININLEGNLTEIIRFIQTLEDKNQFPALEIETTQLAPLSSQNVDASRYDSVLQIRVLIVERIAASQ